MSFWKRLKGELIDIVEWTDERPQTLVHKFTRQRNEIKYGAKLVVRPAQAAVFVNMGKIADVFAPGMYTLETKNLPILSTLQGWKYGFESPFKAEVYFVSTRQFTDLKWGTMNPVMLRDAEFGPVRLRAFGTYTVRCTDPGKLVEEVAGSDAHFSLDRIEEQLRNFIVSGFTDVLGESRIPILDLAANYDELGEFLAERLGPRVDQYGLDLTALLVENISLPPNVEEALDKRSSMGVIGDLKRFTQYQTAEAIGDAAQNEGGGMGDAMGLGAGFAMANQMAQAMGPGAAGQGGPPPVPGAVTYWVAKDGQKSGPHSMEELSAMAGRGELMPDTLVWKDGMASWVKAMEAPEVASIVGRQPPPIPGSAPPPVPPAES